MLPAWPGSRLTSAGPRPRNADRSEFIAIAMSQAGTILIAVGVGLAFFLRALVPLKPVWTIGIIVMLIGAVVVLFAYFSQEPDSRGEAPGHRASD